MWNFSLDRRGDLTIENQIALQIELMIQRGEISAGEKLPSVRRLARQLKIHRNTAAAAYRRLKDWGHLQTSAGSGAYLQRGLRTPTAQDLPAALRSAVLSMLREGLTPSQVKQAFTSWLSAPVPTRVVVLDPALEAAELLAHEITSELGVPAEGRILEEAERQPGLLANSVVAAVPLHWQRVAALTAGRSDLTVLPLTLTLGDVGVVQRLGPGSIILVISQSPQLLLYVSLLIRSLRGDTMLSCHTLADREMWLPRVRLADLVLTDAKSGPVVGRLRSKGLHPVRLIAAETLHGLREALSFPPFQFPAERGRASAARALQSPGRPATEP
jgi:DNA-binding transcriptional regulator YhcF (GntR family)